jgi:hypothetical protein
VITFYLLEIQKNLGGGEEPFLSELIRGNPQTGSFFYNRRFSPGILSSWTPLQQEILIGPGCRAHEEVKTFYS